MFHHDHSISQIPQATQCPQQLVIVSLMKSDTGLIQNISNAYQPRTDLSCQTDTLGFTTGQGSGGTCQGQIIKTHIHQEADSCANFFQNLSADQLLLMSECHLLQKLLQIPHRLICHFKNIFIADSHRQRGRFQSLSFTCTAGRDPHKALILLLHDIGTRLTIPSLTILDQSFKSYRIDAFTSLPFIMDHHFSAIGSMDQHMTDFLRQILIRSIQVKVIGI